MSERSPHSMLEKARNAAEDIMGMKRSVRDASVHAPAPLLAQALLDLFEQLESQRMLLNEINAILAVGHDYDSMLLNEVYEWWQKRPGGVREMFDPAWQLPASSPAISPKESE